MRKQEPKKSGADKGVECRRTVAVDGAGSEAAVVVVGLGQDAEPTGSS